MGFNTGHVTLTTSAKVVCTAPTGTKGPPTVVIQLLTASAHAYLGGPNVTSSGAGIGFDLQNGTAPSAGVLAPLAEATIPNVTGDIYAIGGAGGEVIAYTVSWVDG